MFKILQITIPPISKSSMYVMGPFLVSSSQLGLEPASSKAAVLLHALELGSEQLVSVVLWATERTQVTETHEELWTPSFARGDASRRRVLEVTKDKNKITLFAHRSRN